MDCAPDHREGPVHTPNGNATFVLGRCESSFKVIISVTVAVIFCLIFLNLDFRFADMKPPFDERPDHTDGDVTDEAEQQTLERDEVDRPMISRTAEEDEEGDGARGEPTSPVVILRNDHCKEGEGDEGKPEEPAAEDEERRESFEHVVEY